MCGDMCRHLSELSTLRVGAGSIFLLTPNAQWLRATPGGLNIPVFLVALWDAIQASLHHSAQWIYNWYQRTTQRTWHGTVEWAATITIPSYPLLFKHIHPFVFLCLCFCISLRDPLLSLCLLKLYSSITVWVEMLPPPWKQLRFTNWK